MGLGAISYSEIYKKPVGAISRALGGETKQGFRSMLPSLVIPGHEGAQARAEWGLVGP